MNAAFLILLAVFASVVGAQAAPLPPVALPAYAEGPAVDADGRVFVSDPIEGAVYEATVQGPIVWARIAGANGHEVLPDGRHVVAGSGAVLLLDADGRELRRWTAPINGAALIQPNDLAPDAHGGLWITDPGRWGERGQGRVLYLDPAGALRVAAEGLDFGNGLAVTTDGARLIVAESQKNRLLVYAILGQGRLGPAALFAALPERSTHWTPGGAAEPDGLLIVGHELWVAWFGTPDLLVFDLNGGLTRTVPSGVPSVSNLAPAPDGALFVTGATGRAMGQGGVLIRLARH